MAFSSLGLDVSRFVDRGQRIMLQKTTSEQLSNASDDQRELVDVEIFAILAIRGGCL